MADPVLLLESTFREAIVRAFGDEHAHVDPMLRPSQFADYQVNAALGLAKALKMKPRDVAAKILEHLPESPGSRSIEVTEIAGPGFINVTLSLQFISTALREVATSEDLGLTAAAQPEVVVIDYPSPNVAKEMHVGHLRSTIIGDALARVLEARGHTVVRQNHLGDWGTPFGMLIEHLLDGGEQAEDQSLSDLNAFYKAARTKFDADPEFAARSRRRVVSLQAGDPQTLELWQTLVDTSKRHFGRLYERLGIGLTDADFAGESLYNDRLPSVVDALTEASLAVVDDGAVCVFPPGFKGREGDPLPLIVRKSDGGYGYAATDLAAVRRRVGELSGTRLLYVVGTPQSQHLQMVFAVARMAGWLSPEVKTEHVNFGSVLGSDGKMFKTRDGEVVRLLDLVDEACRRALAVVQEKSPDLPEPEQQAIASAVGVGALKYADLSSDRVKDYVFDYDRMLAFEGNTAPYLQYAHARICSILRKGEVDASPSAIALEHPAEKALGLLLLSFPSVVTEVEASLEPHKLCGYLFNIATYFSTFYQNCSVLQADSAEVRASRLALCRVTAKTLEKGLGLLGIAAPQRM